MTKKSASELKVVKNKTTKAEHFAKCMEVMSYRIKSQIAASKRVDCMVQLRSEYISFFDCPPDIEYLKAIQNSLTEVYENIDKIYEATKLEDLLCEVYEDKIAREYNVDVTNITTEEEMFFKFMAYMYTRPFGEALLSLYTELQSIEE